MLIHNNNGEVVGEMNMSITQDGTVINTNTLYNGGRPLTQTIHPRQSGQSRHNECDRRKDSALIEASGS